MQEKLKQQTVKWLLGTMLMCGILLASGCGSDSNTSTGKKKSSSGSKNTIDDDTENQQGSGGNTSNTTNQAAQPNASTAGQQGVGAASAPMQSNGQTTGATTPGSSGGGNTLSSSDASGGGAAYMPVGEVPAVGGQPEEYGANDNTKKTFTDALKTRFFGTGGKLAHYHKPSTFATKFVKKGVKMKAGHTKVIGIDKNHCFPPYLFKLKYTGENGKNTLDGLLCDYAGLGNKKKRNKSEYGLIYTLTKKIWDIDDNENSFNLRLALIQKDATLLAEQNGAMITAQNKFVVAPQDAYLLKYFKDVYQHLYNTLYCIENKDVLKAINQIDGLFRIQAIMHTIHTHKLETLIVKTNNTFATLPVLHIEGKKISYANFPNGTWGTYVKQLSDKDRKEIYKSVQRKTKRMQEQSLIIIKAWAEAIEEVATKHNQQEVLDALNNTQLFKSKQ